MRDPVMSLLREAVRAEISNAFEVIGHARPREVARVVCALHPSDVQSIGARLATKQPVAGLIQAACCTHDEGRSLDIAIQVEVSNRLKRLRSRVVVVSVEETAGETCQV